MAVLHSRKKQRRDRQNWILGNSTNAAKEQYNDRIRAVLHDLAVEGTDIPLNDGHGHILTDASGNPVMRNTKSEKLLLHLAKVHLPEHKDNGNSSNTINISIGDVHSMYYIGIDLRDWHIDEVAKLKALIIDSRFGQILTTF